VGNLLKPREGQTNIKYRGLDCKNGFKRWGKKRCARIPKESGKLIVTATKKKSLPGNGRRHGVHSRKTGIRRPKQEAGPGKKNSSCHASRNTTTSHTWSPKRKRDMPGISGGTQACSRNNRSSNRADGGQKKKCTGLRDASL